jgi:hypothetical protein
MARRSVGQRSGKSFREINLQMAERFRRWLVAQKYAVSTQQRYHKIARQLCEYIGARPLASVTAMEIGDFLTHTLPGRWADSYIDDRLGPPRSFFDFLYRGG